MSITVGALEPEGLLVYITLKKPEELNFEMRKMWLRNVYKKS
jgi:hypothetical protein